MDPTERVAFVVGAAGAIGRALTSRLLSEGWHVAAAGRDLSRLAALADGRDVSTWCIDARSFDAVHTALGDVFAARGRIDAVVNLAGSILLKPAHTTTQAEWNDVVATNLTTAFAVVRAGAPLLAKSGGGSVVLVASAASAIGLANHEAIAAAKAGVVGLARAAAATYASRSVRVNVVSPGLVETPLSSRITSNPSSRNASLAMHALGRLGNVDDVAAALHYLAGPSSSFVTGQEIGVDGGLARVRSVGAPVRPAP
ncbi:MAG: SDR family oxidoreductase [Polyangiaceae bacterium]